MEFRSTLTREQIRQKIVEKTVPAEANAQSAQEAMAKAAAGDEERNFGSKMCLDGTFLLWRWAGFSKEETFNGSIISTDGRTIIRGDFIYRTGPEMLLAVVSVVLILIVILLCWLLKIETSWVPLLGATVIVIGRWIFQSSVKKSHEGSKESVIKFIETYLLG